MTAIMQSRADERIHAAYKINVCPALSVEKEEESFTLLQPAVSRHQACVCVSEPRAASQLYHT